MTDSQIAKLLSIVDGKGNFLCSVPLNPGKFVDCTMSELRAKLSKFGTVLKRVLCDVREAICRSVKHLGVVAMCVAHFCRNSSLPRRNIFVRRF